MCSLLKKKKMFTDCKIQNLKYVFIYFNFVCSYSFKMQTTNYLMYGYDIIILDIIVYSIIVLTVMLWYISRWRARRFEKIAASMNGPPSYPIVGSWLNFIGTPNRKENNKLLSK